MDYYSAFPFYMGYQGYGQWAQPGMVQEDRILEDLEYLQQMYPTYARKYQSVISSVVDKMDYEGSFIYDQYPDKLTMRRMVDSVMAVIKNNEDTEKAAPVQRDVMPPQMMPENAVQNISENAFWIWLSAIWQTGCRPRAYLQRMHRGMRKSHGFGNLSRC